MKIAVFIIRSLFALCLLAYGINFFYPIKYLPPIPVDTQASHQLQQRLLKTGYFFQMVYGITIACGFFTLINRFTPLFLLIFLPISINILLFNIYLDPGNWDIPTYVLAGNLLLMLIYRNAYSHLFYARANFMKFSLNINFVD